MGRTARIGVATFDAAVMTVAAYQITGGRIGQPLADEVLWGSAIAASVVALVVAVDGPAVVAWAAIGYVLHAALLATEQPNLVLLALAIALMPVVPRPRGSLAFGIVVATAAAFVARAVIVGAGGPG